MSLFMLTYLAGALGGYWWSARAQAQVEAGYRVAHQAPRGLSAAWHCAAQRPVDVRTARLLEDDDSQGAGQGEWRQLYRH